MRFMGVPGGDGGLRNLSGDLKEVHAGFTGFQGVLGALGHFMLLQRS